VATYPIGIVKTAPNPPVATAFEDYVLAPPARRTWQASASCRPPKEFSDSLTAPGAAGEAKNPGAGRGRRGRYSVVAVVTGGVSNPA